jgi:hypothetical protein
LRRRLIGPHRGLPLGHRLIRPRIEGLLWRGLIGRRQPLRIHPRLRRDEALLQHGSAWNRRPIRRHQDSRRAGPLLKRRLIRPGMRFSRHRRRLADLWDNSSSEMFGPLCAGPRRAKALRRPEPPASRTRTGKGRSRTRGRPAGGEAVVMNGTGYVDKNGWPRGSMGVSDKK